MKSKKMILPSLFLLFALLLFSACSGSETSPAATTTPNLEATVAASIAATAEFEAQVEAAIATEVANTVDTAVDEAVDEAVDVAVDDAVADSMDVYAAQTEAELAAMIDEAVAEAVVATESYATATTTATADDQISSDEVQTIELTVQGAETAVAEAEALIEMYYALYNDLAQATMNELAAIESELAAIAGGIEEMNATLVAINETMNAGLALAEETIAQLEAAADTAVIAAQSAQMQSQAWLQAAQAEAEARILAAQQVQANVVAANQQELVNQALSYLETVSSVTADNVLSQEELAQVAQIGANISASIAAVGGPQSQNLTAAFEQMTAQLAAGNLNQAQLDLSGLQEQLIAQFSGIELPSAGALTNFTPPTRPQRP